MTLSALLLLLLLQLLLLLLLLGKKNPGVKVVSGGNVGDSKKERETKREREER